MRIALAQLACVEGNLAGNLAAAGRAVAEAARQRADCVLLPEMLPSGFVEGALVAEVADPWPGRTVAALAALARDHGVALCTSLAEAGPDGRVYNTAVLLAPDGAVLATYRKTHLFDAERRVYTPGDGLIEPVDLLGVRTGLLVCYDVEFPETARHFGLRAASLLLVPSANMEPWGPRHRVFVTARALENHLFVAYCNRLGPGLGMTFVGESVIVDPMGGMVCEAGRDEGVVCGDLDVGLLARSKEVFDYLQERRPALYEREKAAP